MARIALENGKRWFDEEKAEKYMEHLYSDGSNMISQATGSQWEHECLYRTASGTWILNHWSQYQGVPETYTVITVESANSWLSKNDLHDAIEDDALASMEA
jgi:basic membrane lipoprotein Med (substrate-binding protein (PBP1-ABC) superfamily)|tara:strand:- start:40 stop:342 length:303 start_codon:yes stop_codon:yes gene_type:complete